MKKPQRIKFWMIVLFFMIASCGTGFEETNSDGDVSVNVEAGQADVALGSTFTATFSAKVNTSTVINSTFFIVPDTSTNSSLSSNSLKMASLSSQCTSDNALSGTISCASDDLSCTLTLDDELEFETNYMLCLTDKVKFVNPNLNGVFEGVSRSFTTRAGYSIGGTLTGLSGTVVLRNNGANDLTLTSNGDFTFATTLVDGTAYEVTVVTQPTGQTCTVSSGSGTISGANVSDVIVTCSTDTYSVGGTISGLSGTLVLQNNTADDLTLTDNSDWTFATAVADGATYEVTVKTHPTGPNQICSVANGTGTISGANVTNVEITCSTNAYTVGGTISGLEGTVVLQNNATDDLTISADGSYTFATAVADGATYEVTVKTHPTGPNQICSVANGTGTISGANVTNVEITCTTNVYTIGGTVSGLEGTVVLQNNATDDLTISADGSYTFATAITDGEGYNVTVTTQPTGQTCVASGGSGTVAGANITNVNLACTDDYKLVFITNGTSNGNLGGLSGADTFCQNEADAAGLRGTYSAWLSTGSVNAKDRISQTGPYVLVDETTTVADDLDELISGTLQNSISLDGNENVISSSSNVWTGTLQAGTAATDRCSNWTSSSNSLQGLRGSSDASDQTWTNTNSTVGCHISNRIYCFKD